MMLVVMMLEFKMNNLLSTRMADQINAKIEQTCIDFTPSPGLGCLAQLLITDTPVSITHLLPLSGIMQDEPPKFFIQMSGAPGAGKSTIARLLRQSMQGVVIDHDILRSSILESGTIPFNQAAKQAYNLQWALARDMMKQGLNIIIDSPCNYSEAVTQGSALASQCNYVYWYVECVVKDIELLDQRLRTRKAMISQRTAIDRPPAAVQNARLEEDTTASPTTWIKTPSRPNNNNIVVVDSTTRPEIIRDQILKQIIG